MTQQVQQKVVTKKEVEAVDNKEAVKRTEEQEDLLRTLDELIDEIDEELKENEEAMDMDIEPEYGTMAHVLWMLRKYGGTLEVIDDFIDLPCGCF